MMFTAFLSYESKFKFLNYYLLIKYNIKILHSFLHSNSTEQFDEIHSIIFVKKINN